MRKGFTLMELMVVVTIVGIMAAFAIPSYTKAVEKSKARDVVNNLYAIGAAQVVYKAKYGTYYLPGGSSINEINSNLGLNLIQQSGFFYMCSSALSGIPPGACIGAKTGGWAYMIKPSTWMPFCSSGGMGGFSCPNGVP